MAKLYDTSVDIQLSPHASIGFFYGYAKGKSVIKHIYPPRPNGQLGFVEVNYGF